jgi:hypothetical protein
MLGTAIFAFAFFSEVTSGSITNDEAWFLQVARRMVSGDVLYRDVFFGVTPISAYVAAGLVRLLGIEILVVRGMMAASLAAACLLSLRIARQLHLSRTAQALVVLGILAFVPSWLPGAGSPYTPLAYVFLLVCWSSFLDWREATAGTRPEAPRRAGWMIALAGAFAGLAFVTKQTIGIYTLAALVGAIYLTPPSESDGRLRARAALIAGLSFVAVAVLFLAPVVLNGGTEKFLEYGFLNRLNYVQAASIPYWENLLVLAKLVRHPAGLADLAWAYWNLQFLLPLIALPLLAVAWWRSGAADRGTTGVLAVFALAALVGVVPRVDLPHMAPAVPALLIILAWCVPRVASHTKPWPRKMAHLLAASFLLLGIGALLAKPVRWLARGDHVFSPIPHFQSVLLDSAFAESILADRQAIQSVTHGDPVFFLSPSAGLLYLAFERENPTPYDYPLVTTFGLEGEADLFAAFEHKAIPWVCLSTGPSATLAPEALESLVRDRLALVGLLQMCQLFSTVPLH